MDRERLLELISGLLDGELSESENAELQSEIESSESARSLLESHREQASLLRALDAPRAPLELKEKLNKQLPGTTNSPSAWRHWSSMMLAVAASFCFLWGGQALQTHSATPVKLYLQRGLISSGPPADFHSVVLQPGRNESEVFLSPPEVGYWAQGPAIVKFKGDGGTHPGQMLRVKLSVDLNGDKEWELVEESELIELDAISGHQEFSIELPLASSTPVGVLVEGQVKLELFGESMSAEGIHILFPPNDSHLLLPLDEGAVKL